jgi:prephenate dehydrogenase
MVLIEKMTIIGVGLIGGSLARSLRRSGMVGTIAGYDLCRENLLRAVDLGVIDTASVDLAGAVTGADLVFISTPVCSIPTIVGEMASFVKRGCIVTDGGSVKGEIVRLCEQVLPAGVHFVGGHPIAGTENSGVAASFAGLFDRRRCILTPTPKTNPEALAVVSRMWEAAGSEVIEMDVERHDKVVAAISHLPHMVAYSLVNAVENYSVSEENILKYSAGGFKDFTRIASSDPQMWRDIAIMNRDGILEVMDLFLRYFDELRQMILHKDTEGIRRFMEDSKLSRDALI